MSTAEENPQEMEVEPRRKRILALLSIGFVMIFAGIVLIILASTFSGTDSASIGGVIFIGPIPIAFAAGPEAKWLILFALVLAVLTVATIFLMIRRLPRKAHV